jgi:hypothetical protein
MATAAAPRPPAAARPADGPRGLSPLDAVRRRYAALYTAATADTAAGGGGGVWPGAGGPLPPYLCRLLNRAKAPGRAARAPYAVLATGADPLVAVGSGPLRLRYATAIAPRLLDAVGLRGVRAVRPGPKTTARLAEAADTLGALLPEAATAVERYVTAVVLLKAADSAEAQDRTVCRAVPGLPFTAFLSGLGLHHMVPAFSFAAPSVYTLQESLYHTALRLALNEERRLAEHFATPRDAATLIYVSWESDWRTAGHCLRRLYVYAHLARLRTAALHAGAGPEEAVLTEALRSVTACARELAGSLGGLRHLFSDAGRALLDCTEALLPPAETETRP